MKRVFTGAKGRMSMGLIGRIEAYIRLNGAGYTLRRAGEKFRDRVLGEYDRVYRRVRADENELARQRTETFPAGPLVTVLVPVYNTDPRMLREMAQSLLDQTCGRWEAVLYDGQSTKQETLAELDALAERDPRLRVIRGAENLHISGNSNMALKEARGTHVALLDHDDLLTPDAVYHVMKAITESDPDMIYSDEDKISEDSRTYFEPHFKPDFCLDNLRSGNYICHLMVLRRELIAQAGGFRSAFDGSQDHDLALRASEHTTRICHIPRVLYHWRSVGSSMSHQNLMRCVDAACRAVEENMARTGEPGRVTLEHNCLRVHYDLRGEPLVSVIVRGDGEALAACLHNLEKTSWKRIEYLAATGDAALPETKLQGLHRVDCAGLGRFAALNKAAGAAAGEVLVLLDAAVQPEQADWVEELLMHAQRTGVCAVTPVLFDRRGRILHAGYALGRDDLAACRQLGLPRTAGGWHGLEHTAHDVGALSACCVMLRRDRFLPFDAQYETDLGSADWSIRLREAGGNIVFTPFSKCTESDAAPVLRREERSSRDAERYALAHGERVADPTYSAHFTRKDAGFHLDLDERGKNVY